MSTEQRNAAQQEMVRWLCNSKEFGREPARIECAGKFELQGMRYYVFRYKRQLPDQWTLGICGGFEGEALENCGYVFSEQEEYGEEDVSKRAARLVKYVRSYWEEQEKMEEEQKKRPGDFVNLVLLEDTEWNKKILKKELEEKWKLTDKKDFVPKEENLYRFGFRGATVTVEMVPTRVSGDEMDYGARKNHIWRSASSAVKRHRAYLSVTVKHGKLSSIESGILLVKTVAACCSLPGVLGVYANGTVYQVEQYKHFSGMARAGVFPVQNLVWFGRYNGKKGLCGYTFGLSQFGYDEVEVLNSTASEQELDDFFLALTNYIIYHNMVLKHGETLGFQSWQKLPVTKSKGVAVPGESIKIGFPGVKTVSKTGYSGYVGRI